MIKLYITLLLGIIVKTKVLLKNYDKYNKYEDNEIPQISTINKY